MHADPDTLIAAVAAMIGGLLGFAALLLAGVALVHVLRLPQDLPDGPRFEPPAPPLRAQGERSSALLAAARQAGIAALYARARALELAARECQALAVGPAAAPAAVPGSAAPASNTVAAQCEGAVAASATAGEALRAFDQRLRAAPGADAGTVALAAVLAAQEPVVAGALAAARRLAASGGAAPAPRRRWLLLVAVLVLWLAALTALLWR
jgi:hypothetical protein